MTVGGASRSTCAMGLDRSLMALAVASETVASTAVAIWLSSRVGSGSCSLRGRSGWISERNSIDVCSDYGPSSVEGLQRSRVCKRSIRTSWQIVNRQQAVTNINFRISHPNTLQPQSRDILNLYNLRLARTYFISHRRFSVPVCATSDICTLSYRCLRRVDLRNPTCTASWHSCSTGNYCIHFITVVH